MTSVLAGKGIYGFGIEPLLELPWDDPEDAWDFVEHVRMHGTVPTDTEGSVLGTDSAYNNRRCWYVGGGHGLAHKLTYEEWVNTKQERKDKERRELIEHLQELKRAKDDKRKEHEEFERMMAQQSQGLRSWAERDEEQRARDAESRRKYQESIRVQREREAADQHEHAKLWAEQTSEIERIIFESTENIDCSVMDRSMMRAMMRYMNFGAGKGRQWDTREFALYIVQTRRDDLLTQTINDIERCYRVLMSTVVTTW